MAGSSMPWVKMYVEMLDEIKMEELSDGESWRFVQLILLAGEFDAEGYLPCSTRKIAWRLRMNESQLLSDMQVLNRAELVFYDEEKGFWCVTNFSKRQGRSQAEKRDIWRERQQRHRDATRSSVFKRSRHFCEYCGREIDFDTFIVDHIIPPFKGGEPSDLSNLAAACRSCNTKKGDKLLTELGWKNPRESDNRIVTSDKLIVTSDNRIVTPLDKSREEEEEESSSGDSAGEGESSPEPSIKSSRKPAPANELKPTTPGGRVLFAKLQAEAAAKGHRGPGVFESTVQRDDFLAVEERLSIDQLPQAIDDGFRAGAVTRARIIAYLKAWKGDRKNGKPVSTKSPLEEAGITVVRR